MMALSLIAAHLNYFRSVVPTPASKSAPGLELKGALIGGAGVRRLTVRDDHMLEWSSSFSLPP